jgi:anti-anti-sigma factor
VPHSTSQTSLPPLVVRVQDHPGIALVEVEGELDLDGAPDLCAAIQDRARHHVIVDLSGVDFCDSTGLKALIDAAREVAIGGGQLVAIVPGDGPVRRVIDMTGAAEFLAVSSDREQVLAGISRADYSTGSSPSALGSV